METHAPAAEASLRERREAIVREHIETENAHDGEATLRTFAHPRYELIATDEVIDGDEAVAAMYDETYTAFPDFAARVLRLHHADDAVIIEAEITGTHDGPYRGLPPTGRRIKVTGCAFYGFEDDRLVCERATGMRPRCCASSASRETRKAPAARSRWSSRIR